MIAFILKLLLAHLTGDFILQPQRWVAAKEINKIRSKYLYYHIAVHALCLLLVLGFNFRYWGALLIIIISHYIIDALKLLLQTASTKRFYFFADQVLHFIMIAVVVNIYFPFRINWSVLFAPQLLLFLCFLIIVSKGIAIVIQLIISRWQLKEWLHEEGKASEGLEKAGFYIGILERLFVFIFIVLNHWEAIGFLLAAKSIFRFGDLTKARDCKLTEYILMGTLISFGLAIASGIIFKYLYKQL